MDETVYLLAGTMEKPGCLIKMVSRMAKSMTVIDGENNKEPVLFSFGIN